MCFQASWFCIQSVFRLAHKYPISLLELNVFGHAICTFIIYLMWWDKPFDIEQPSLIRGVETEAICALMCFINSHLGKGVHRHIWVFSGVGGYKDLNVEFSRSASSVTSKQAHESGKTQSLESPEEERCVHHFTFFYTVFFCLQSDS